MKFAACLLLCWGTTLANFYAPSTWLGEELELKQTIEDQKGFRNGREFKYIYNGQSMTGIPGTSKQHGGSRIQAHVKFVCKHGQSCIMQIEQIRLGNFNRGVKTPRNVLPFDTFQEMPLPPQQRQKLLLPLKYSIDGGLISNIVFDGLEKPWSANIKRGILNMMQVNLKNPTARSDMDVVDAIEDQLLNVYKPTETDASFYRTMEETIEGECETIYTVTKPPMFKLSRANVFNVTKTINFEKCLKRPQIKYNFHFSTPCPSSDSKYDEDQKFLKSSSISSYQVVKMPKSNIVSNAYTESEYVFVPFNEEANAVVTYVSQNLKLIKVGFPTYRVQVPMNPQKSDSDMVYNLGQDISRELFQMENDATGFEQFVLNKNQDNVELALVFLRKLVNNIREQVQEPATKHFNQLVNLVRILSKSQIDHLHQAIYMPGQQEIRGLGHNQQKIARELLHDALGSAGTKAAVQHLTHKIKRREISTIKAISAISNLKNMLTPSKEIIQELIDFAEHPAVERHFMLKQTTWLTIGTLIKGLCSNEADQYARESKESSRKICPKNLKEEYVKVLSKKLYSSHQWDDQMIYIKALGNAGLDLSIFELEKVINNKNFNYRNMIRVEAVLALRHLKSIMPKKIQKVLVPIVFNQMEPETLRITAAYLTLQTLPSRPVIDQLAKIVQNERSLQVASFIDSYMNTMANSTNPCEKKLSTNLKLALRQMHTIYSRTLGTSKFRRMPFHSQRQRIGLDLDLASTFSGHSPIPRQLAASVHSNFLGFWKKYLVSLRLSTEGIDRIANKAYGASVSSFLRSEYENIFSELNGRTNPSSEEPKAMFSLKVKNQDTIFVPIKRHAVESFLKYGRVSDGAAATLGRLRQGVHVNYNKAGMADEILFSVPTTLGMPVRVHIKVPYVINVHGAIKLVTGGSKIGAFQLKAALKPGIVASVSVDVKTWSPMVASGVNVVNKIKAFQPIDAKLLVNMKGETKVVKLLFKRPTQQKDLITVQSRPYTYSDAQPGQPMSFNNKQKRLVLSEEGNRIRSVHKCGTCNLLGIRFCVKGQYHKTPINSPTGTPFAPLSGPNKIVISAEPSGDQGTLRTIAINLYGKFLKPVSQMSQFRSSIFGSAPTLLSGGRTPSNEDTPIFDSLMDEAAQVNDYESSEAPLLSHSSMKCPHLNSLRIEIESADQQRLSADLLHVFNADRDYHKVQAKVHRSSSPSNPQPFKAFLNAETVLPTLALIKQLPNGKVIGKLSAHWGHSSQSPNFIHIVKHLEKGYQSKIHELQNPEWNVHQDLDLNQDNLLKNSPLKYVLNIKYNNVPLKAKHYANEILRYIKNNRYDQTNVAEIAVNNRPRHVKIIVAVDPITWKKADVLIKTPKSNTFIRDLVVPQYASPITHKRDYIRNQIKYLEREIELPQSTVQCYATEFNVKTFNDQEIHMPSSPIYKVLAKDCASNQYTVLVKQMSRYKHLKEVKIITNTNNKVVLRPSNLKPRHTKVFINGRDYTTQNNVIKTEAGLPTLKVIKQGGHVKVEIINAGVSIYFDRKSVNVEVPPHKRNTLCGLCSGSFNSEMERVEMGYSDSRDTLQYYFGAPSSRAILIGLEQQDDLFEGQQGSMLSDFYNRRNQGWSEPSEREWEIKEMTNGQNDLESQLDQINAEFNQFYTPIESIEQQIEKQMIEQQQERMIEHKEDQIDEADYLQPGNVFSHAFDLEKESFEQEEEVRQVMQQENDFFSSGAQQWWAEELIEEEQIERQKENVLAENYGQREWTGRNFADNEEYLLQEIVNGKQQGRQQKIVETEHSICISKTLAQCIGSSFPKWGKQQTVAYHCMSRKNPKADQYLNEILSGRRCIVNLASKPTSMTRMEMVPDQCQQTAY